MAPYVGVGGRGVCGQAVSERWQTPASMKSLPRGRHGLSREFVAQNQRERLLASTAESLARARLRRDHRLARSPPRSASPRATSTATSRARTPASSPPTTTRSSGCASRSWRLRGGPGLGGRGLRGALPRCSASWRAEPARANMLLGRGAARRARRLRPLPGGGGGFVPYLRDGAPAPATAVASPEGIDEAVVGGIASLLGRRVLAGEAERLREFFPEIAEFALTPYLGARRGAPHNLRRDERRGASGSGGVASAAALDGRSALAGAERGDRGRMGQLRRLPDPARGDPARQHRPAPRRLRLGAALQLPARRRLDGRGEDRGARLPEGRPARRRRARARSALPGAR